MRKNSFFLIEESEKTSDTIDKTDIDKAVYSGKFDEYIIAKSHLLKDTLIITDMLSGRDGVDIINSSIDELIFKDCVKKFSEIYSNFTDAKEFNDTNSESNVSKWLKCNDYNDEFTFKFTDEIEISSDIVKSIKIFINGYDESSESVNLNLEFLKDVSEYKYKITSDTIEISILTKMTADLASKFLKTFLYKKIGSDFSGIKEIYVVINDALAYKTEIKM